MTIAMRAGAIAMMLAAAPAAAAEPREQWVVVGTHVDGGAIEIDRRSIAPFRDLWRAWWRIRFAAPRPDGAAVEKHLDLVDCRDGLSSTVEVVSLRADGSIAGAVREPDSAALTRLAPVTPGTAGETVARAACRFRPPPR